MDHILIEDLTVFAKHGVLEAEKQLGQKFLVSVDFSLPYMWKPAMKGNLRQTVDYGEACQKITAFEHEHPVLLLETAGEQLARFLLHEYREIVSQVTVTIKKPWAPIGLPLETAAVSVRRGWHDVYIGLGSNLGDREQYIREALHALSQQEDIEVVSVSDLIETEPYGYKEQGAFINACARLRTVCEPEELLDILQSLEQAAHRERTIHWGPRTLDLDILLYDREVIATDRLAVPHPELERRTFVLEPLNQLAPQLRHPISQVTMKELLDRIQDKK